LNSARVAEGRQPPLASGRPDLADLVIGVVEERLQLVPGERPLARVTLGVLDVHRGIPLVHDLRRVGAEPGLALGRPAVGRVGGVLAEQPDRQLVAAQRGAAQAAHRPQVGHPVIDQLRRPRPRERIGMGGERADDLLPALHRGERQPPGQLLVPPAVQHRGERLLPGPKQHHPGCEMQPRRARPGLASYHDHPPALRAERENLASDAMSS
jgi:hypothetical protein